jgi:hypothetical protein
MNTSREKVKKSPGPCSTQGAETVLPVTDSVLQLGLIPEDSLSNLGIAYDFTEGISSSVKTEFRRGSSSFQIVKKPITPSPANLFFFHQVQGESPPVHGISGWAQT